jgi:tubby-related protein 1
MMPVVPMPMDMHIARAGAGASAGAGRGAASSSMLDLRDMRRFLTSPVPFAAGIIQCYIERDRSGVSNRLYPVYSLYLKDGDRFLCASRKRSNNKTSNYLISQDKRDLNRDSASFLGKLRANFVGTEFVGYDDGAAPDAKPGSDPGSSGQCALIYRALLSV